MKTKQMKKFGLIRFRYVLVMMGAWISFSSGATIVNAQNDIERHLKDVENASKSSWPMRGLRRKDPEFQHSGYSNYTVAKIKTLEEAVKFAKVRYLDVTGTELQSDEIMTVTELWPRIDGDLWCITVLRVDGRTRYPRISNRLWIDATTERISAMLPKTNQKETITSERPSTADGSLIPMLLQPTSEADNLKKRLAQMKFPNPKSIDGYNNPPAPGTIEELHFCDLFALGRDIKDFGKDGDLIWVARRSAWQCFYAEEWFNSRNGKTLKFRADSLAPPKKEKQNPGDRGR